MKLLCTICARGGSKSVKNKNIRNLLDKPLIAHSILQAKHSKLFDYLAVSSDSPEILEVAKAWGADCLIERPDNLSTDTAPKVPAIQHCVQEAERLTKQNFDTIVDLDVTSPLRSIEDIQGCVDLLENKKVSNVITVSKARRSPYFNLLEVNEAGVVHLSKPLPTQVIRRQDSPQCYDANASIYVWQREALYSGNTIFLKDTALFVMPEERSIDIDSEFDFDIVEFLAEKRKTLY